MEANRPLPYRGWEPILIRTKGRLFEADIGGDRLVAAAPSSGYAYDPAGQNRGFEIQVFRISTGELKDTLSLPGPQKVLGFSSDTHYAWIGLDEGSTQIARLNLDTRAMDRQISILPSGVSGDVRCRQYPADPDIVLVSAKLAWWPSYAYAAGRLIADMPSLNRPVDIDDRGRVVFGSPGGYRACELNASSGLTNCEPIAARGDAFIKDRAINGQGVVDVRSGQLIAPFVPPCGKAAYLPESRRILACEWLYDGVSYAGVGKLNANGMQLGYVSDLNVTTVQLRAPDWLLAYAEHSYLLCSQCEPEYGILAAQLPHFRPAPSFSESAVVHAATGEVGAIAAGEIVSIFGQNLGPDTPSGPLLEDGLLLSTEIERTQVFFNGTPAAILYADAGQINAVAPEAVRDGDPISVQVTRYGIPSERAPLRGSAFSPGLFAYNLDGKRYAVAHTMDGVLQSPAAPLARGRSTTFWATGAGLPAGAQANSVVARAQQLSVSPILTLGGAQAKMLYAGSSPGATAGLTQLNVEIPADCPVGTVEAVISVGGKSRGGVWVVVQ
jgi:uncharacterized protein (TIGR03437 family)